MRWVQWRNYYGFGPGKPGGPQPQCAKWGSPGSGCRAKTLAREASDMLQCRFLTIRILKNLSLKSGKRHFRDSRFKNFPGEHALDPLENSCIRIVPLAFLLGGPSKILNRGPPDITLRHWMGHFKDQFPTALQYTRNLANTVYKSIKRVVVWSAYYHMHPQ